jgi:predicted MFS family arabinose efflux permease
LPAIRKREHHDIFERTTRGLRIYLATPRLRGLLALNLAVAAAGAMVIVNTVVLVQSDFQLRQTHTAIALGAFGGGSMLAALMLPGVLDKVSDRAVMLTGALLLVIGLCAGPFITSYSELLALWLALGLAYSLTLTPSGRLLRRSADPEDRPAVYAAQFALSHACWLLTYPLAGWVGAMIGSPATFVLLAALAAAGLLMARACWPRDDSEQFAGRLSKSRAR